MCIDMMTYAKQRIQPNSMHQHTYVYMFDGTLVENPSEPCPCTKCWNETYLKGILGWLRGRVLL